MVTYEVSNCLDGYRQCKDMFERHHAEVSMLGGPKHFTPDVHRMTQYDDMGLAFTILAKDDNEVIGYCLGTCDYHPHYLGVKFASVSFIYVVPERRGLVSIKLLKFAEAYVKDKMGAKYFQVGVNKTLDVSKMFERMGYVESNIIMTKRL